MSKVAAATAASAARVTDLLRQVWRIRLVEERIADLYTDQQMRCPVHLSIGQEGIAVGVCAVLQPTDAVMSGHRAHAHYLAKGGNLPRMLAEIYGRKTGVGQGRGGSMHLIDQSVNFIGSTPIVGSTIPIATGVAWAAKIKQQPIVTVLFMGEGAAEEGVWHESLNFAALHKLPIIFVCENNLYSVYTHVKDRQPDRPLTAIAAAHGLATYRGDGNDTLQVQKDAAEAAHHARTGAGPVFMELTTYRWREHCGPNYDNDLGYRTEAEFEQWQQHDPLERLQQQLLQTKQVTQADLLKIKATITLEIDEAVRFAQTSQFPVATDLAVADTYAVV